MTGTVKDITSWMDAILGHFVPKRERMLLVIDPDNLLRDDALLAEVQNRNYDVLELEDEVSFRNRFERDYRSRWDIGEALHIVVVVHTTNGERHIPYDIWKKSKRIELSVSQLFPNLNAIVVSQLDNAYYADLYPAHQGLVSRREMRRGERQTIEFILRTVFDLDPVGVADPTRWIEFLIHKHYSARELPPALEGYVIQHLLPQVAPAGLRAEFLADSELFYTWLGEMWAAYLDDVAAEIEQPAVDLGDARLRPLLGHLFAEGLLRRAPAPKTAPPLDDWIAIGVQASLEPGPDGGRPIKDQSHQALFNLQARLARFVKMDQTTLPTGKTDLRDWLDLANEWAEVVYQANSMPQGLYDEVQPALSAARSSLDGHFWSFLQERYSAVHYYQDNRGPICLTAVNRWIRQHVSLKERVALLCFDGLALDQWFLLREVLQSTGAGLDFRENRTFAVAPTITPVSRQALFAGRPPTAFAETLQRTDRDAGRWSAYWVNQNIPPRRVAHAAIKVSGRGVGEVRAIAESKNRRLGVLVNLFDEAMHGVEGMPPESDKRVLYSTLRGHLEAIQGHLADLFGVLQNYRVFLTADHGNIAGVGAGLRPPKALVESYARRVAIFDRAELAKEYAATHGFRILRTKALPPEVHPVYLPGTQLFGTKGAAHVSHGGLSLEELVVPFVEVLRP